MKIVAWMVVKEDEYYVDMAIKSVAPFVEAIYVQDQKSNDNTVKIIQESVGKTPLWIDEVDTGLERPTREQPIGGKCMYLLTPDRIFEIIKKNLLEKGVLYEK